MARNFCVLPWETSGLPDGASRAGNQRERKNEMMKRSEESDDRVVAQGRRKAERTEARARGAKAITASKEAKQLDLFSGTADSPKGNDAEVAADQSAPATSAVPKPESATEKALPAMTMEEVTREENLRSAFEKVRANRGASGVDRKTVEDVAAQLDELLPRLQHELLTGQYRPDMIRRVWIPKAAGGQRGLGIPTVIDRTVQQAVLQVMSPHYEPKFHDSSHGFRTERSSHTAIAEAKRHLEEGYEWVVDIDLEKFFDRVNHDRLLARLSRNIEDKRLLRLLRQMLSAKVVMPSGVVMDSEEGTPQGGPLSPLLSNIVLDELDWELERRGHRFVRYADDCNIYVRAERSGKRVMQSIGEFIERKLRLKINVDKSAVATPDERHFLGFRLKRKPWSGDVEVKLSRRSMTRIYENVRRLTPRNWGQSVERCIKQVNAYLRGWFGYFRICTSERWVFDFLDSHIRRRLRALVLRHWKRKRFIARRLISMGVRARTTWRSLYAGRAKLWALSDCYAVKAGLSNKYFAELGLISLLEQRSLYLKDLAAIARSERSL